MENKTSYTRLQSVAHICLQVYEQGFLFAGEESALPGLLYVEQGRLRCVVDGQGLDMEAGDLVLFGTGTFHMHYADVGEAPRVLRATFRMEGQELPCGTVRADDRISAILDRLSLELSRQDAYTADMTFALLTQLLVALCRERELVQPNPGSGEGAIIRRAQQYIGSHPRQKLSVPLVARMVDVSPSYLTALFHKRLGIAPGEYIRRVKLQLGRQMIRRGDMSFTEIAAALSYSTVHHFSRQFKEKFGITPSEYAKAVKPE